MPNEPRTEDAPDDRSSPAAHPITSLLDELDLLGSVSSLDMRILDAEQQLQQITERVDLSSRRQLGELDVMRAQINDLVALLRDSASGHEDAMVRLDGDLAGLLDARVGSLMKQVADIREDVAAQTQAALARLDESIATLRGEATADADEATRRLDVLAERIEQLAATLAEQEATATSSIDAEGAHRRRELESLEKRINGRVDVAAEAAADARQRLDERIEALRRELDAASGETRAHVAVALADVTGRMDGLDERLRVGGHGSDELQAVARDLSKRVDEAERRLRDALRDEAAARTGALSDVADQAAESLRLAREALDRDATDQVRAVTETDKAATDVQAVSARLNALQSTLAHALNDVAHGLSNRVATLAGQVEGLRDGMGRAQERLGVLERIEARLTALESAQRDRSAEQDLAQQISEVQRELSRVAGRLDSFARQAAAADERAEALRRDVGVLGDDVATAGAWRSELRDLTARTSELAARVAEAETIARRAGNAVVEAVRQARDEEEATHNS